MAYYACPGCDQLFHEPEPKAYVWCSCGQPLSAAEIVDDPPTAEPPAATLDGRELDEFDRRAMVGAIYSPCFLRAIVKRKLTQLGDADLVFEVAVSDGDDFASIVVQVRASGHEGAQALEEIVERSVEEIAAGFDREARLTRLVESAPFKLASPVRASRVEAS
jgi:hypothetical protein